MKAVVWLLASVMVAAASVPAHAEHREITVLAPNLPNPGATLDEVRDIKLDKGLRLVCESDADKPRLAEPRLMDSQGGRSNVHIRRCSIFQAEQGDIWSQATIRSVAGPARIWMIFVQQGGIGRFRLAQFSLWAKTDGWDATAKVLSDILGPAAAIDRLLTWQDDQHDVMMFADEKRSDEFAVAVGDSRLRRLMKSPGNTSRPE
ncbi:conserved exported hypothetical protein [Candidatus Terasakiella magnetica]|nr:conserved exported hypothetical protein [Candidatus Terasakiella magnetica]